MFVSDLIELYDRAIQKISQTQGMVYNVGGGYKNVLSIWSEFGPLLENLFGRKINVSYSDWRPGDQKVYISDISLVEKQLGWQPKVKVEQGIENLYKWVQKNKDLFKKLF